jgi:hypothetical protein
MSLRTSRPLRTYLGGLLLDILRDDYEPTPRFNHIKSLFTTDVDYMRKIGKSINASTKFT